LVPFFFGAIYKYTNKGNDISIFVKKKTKCFKNINKKVLLYTFLCYNINKGGANVKYYEEMANLQVFSKEDINRIAGNSNAAKMILKDYVRSGLIQKIKFNYYATYSIENHQPIASRFVIGSNVNDKAYISHHSAFEYYGLHNQVFNSVYVSSVRSFKEFKYDEIIYIPVKEKSDKGVDKIPNKINVTNIERTVVDCIDDIGKAGGLEELLHCIGMVPFVNENSILDLLNEYDRQFMYQKTGYILSMFKDKLSLSPAFFDKCKEQMGKSKRYLYNELKMKKNVYDEEWQLVTKSDARVLLD